MIQDKPIIQFGKWIIDYVLVYYINLVQFEQKQVTDCSFKQHIHFSWYENSNKTNYIIIMKPYLHGLPVLHYKQQQVNPSNSSEKPLKASYFSL